MTPFFSPDVTIMVTAELETCLFLISVLDLCNPVILFIFCKGRKLKHYCSVTAACVAGCGSRRGEAADFGERHAESRS